jgi:hypothetical protein
MLLSRILALVPLLLGVILFVFIVMQFSPTDPALAAFDGGNATHEQLEEFRRANGLLDPLPLQYVHFVWRLLQGDFGTSVITKQPVGDTIATALPLTVQLTVLGLVIAVVVSLVLGVTSAFSWASVSEDSTSSPCSPAPSSSSTRCSRWARAGSCPVSATSTRPRTWRSTTTPAPETPKPQGKRRNGCCGCSRSPTSRRRAGWAAARPRSARSRPR